MKKIPQLLSIGIILIFLFSTCSIEKRRYMSGYNIQWNNSKSDTKKNKSGGGDEINSAEQSIADNIVVDETVTASANNSHFSTNRVSEKPNLFANTLPEDCDVITLKNGNEIKVKAFEISQKEIKYRKCEELNGPTYTLKKSEVFMIKYANGTKDVFIQDTSAETKNKPIEKEESGVFGILSFVTVIISAIVAASGGAVALYVLLPVALVFAAIGLGKRKKFKGFAIASLSIIGAFVFLLLLYALTWEDTNCFTSGTKILIGNHTEINIESIKKGDCVITYDFENNRLMKTEVEKLITAVHSNLFKLTFDDGEITVTDDHPFWVAAKGWVSLNPDKSNNNYRQENSINRLTVGDSLFLPAENKFTRLQNIQRIEKEQLTYTIELKEENNFIANGLLVKTEQTMETEEIQVLTSVLSKSK